MSKEIVVKVENVYKTFHIPHERNSSLKATVLNIFKRKTYTEFPAAKGISFEVREGEFLGIIGRNGCGKSTMLKMLAGIYMPDKGKITVKGRLSPFLELGVGFNPDLTARENVYLNGTILGLNRKEINAKYNDIVDFAELEEFMDQKLKNFSSGMQVRLAFSVAIQAHADILLIDEVLAVGDSNFQKKCNDVFRRLKVEGKTIIFVSHSMEAIKNFCDRVILIHEGKILSEGNPEKVAYQYERLNLEGANSQLQADTDNQWGDRRVEISSFRFLVDGKENIFAKTGDHVAIEVDYKNNQNHSVITNFSIGIYNEGNKCFDASTYFSKPFVVEASAKGKIIFNITGLALLSNSYIAKVNKYNIDLMLFGKEPGEVYHVWKNAFTFMIKNDEKAIRATGIVNLDCNYEIKPQ